ncbi:hypothetical protein [Cryobacterium zhongshanensis]|uniref:Uncharacterized protein n=1 Tax=Cryobacterium zhongshanensis TaxID=2928153 RepID=A0AA41QXT2_9MICO|nr:hypothetical protein [Cryobacterium zhongshanensis]MCI4659582.1 hypothetical protein [Cryobacterium zhongshanensis]
MTETTIAHKARRSLLAFLRESRGGRVSTPVPAEPAGKKPVWSVKKSIALGMMLLIPLVGFLGTSAAQATDDDAMKFSFYKVASSTTAFFSNVQQPDNHTGFNASWNPIIQDPGSAGSLLGYADPNFSSVTGWMASKLSGSSDAIGYETLLVRSNTDDSSSFGASKFQGMVDYAYFGAALKGMGLDGTSTGLSLGFMNVVSGGLVMLLYILGGAVDFVFNAFVGLLSVLNPFKLFYIGVAAISPEFANGMVGNGTADVGPLSGLASFIGGWYTSLNTLAWTVMVPLFIGILLFSLVMFKKMDRGGALKKIVIRVVFIGLGLPLLGTMYTGMVNSMADASSDGNAGSTRVVMSTYVDFENWAMKSRLAIPASAIIEWDPSSAQASGAAQANVRNSALAINNQSLSLGLTPIVSATTHDATWSNQILEGKSADVSTKASAFSTTVDMLMRFMGNAQVSAASFETTAKGELTQSAYYQANANTTVKGWFENMEKDANALNADDAAPSSNPLIAVQTGTGLQGSGSGVRKLTSSVSGCMYTGTSIASYDGSARACNLSPLAMYNYLNTDFGSTSMTMYSSSNVMSEATRSIHNSVNQVGTGTMGFLYWFNAVVLLGSFVLIGLGYAFSLLFASIRRSFQIITAVPFATLGALAAIAKVVVYSVALILEVIITIFVYRIVQEFLTSLPQLIEMPFAQIMNNGAGGTMAGFVTFLTSGWAFGMVVTLLSIVGVLVFTVMALRVRKTLVKAVEEAVTKLVEKFMDTQVGMPGGGKMAPAIAGGLAAGAGAAAANRMMSGGMSKSPAAAALPGKGAAGGPAGIETAGGTTEMGSGPDGGGSGQLAITEGAAGNGDQGSALALSGTDGANGTDGGSAADEVALGRNVETNGLSKQGEIRGPQVGGDDAMSAASSSLDKSAEGYKAADTKALDAGKEGAQAAGHAGLAVGRGLAGDGAGAAESGGRALEHGGSAVAAGEQAKQAQADAGRSSLDKPDQRHAQRAGQAQKVSQAGGMVANAAGAAKGTSGGAGGGAAVKAPKPAQRSKVAPAPARQSAPRPPQKSQPAASTPSAVSQRHVQQSHKAAPMAPRQQAPKPAAAAPAGQAPQRPAPKAPQQAKPASSAPKGS